MVSKNTKTKKKGLSKTTVTVLWVIIIAALLMGTFTLSYTLFVNNTVSKYERQIKQIVNDISTANTDANNIVNNTTINPEDAKKELPKVLSSLEKASNDLDNNPPGNDYKNQNNYITTGLKNNILMYRQALAIFNNPNASDIKDSVTDFNNYKDNCETQYSKFQVGNITISVFAQAKNFINIFQSYTDNLVKVNTQAALDASQYQKYVDTMDDMLSKFASLKTDFSVELGKARNHSMSYDDVVSLATNDLNACDDLINEAKGAVSPSNFRDGNSNFIKILNTYDSYIQSFINSVNNEKVQAGSSTTPLDAAALKDIYFTPSNMFTSIGDSYDAFVKKYTDLKNNH
ncbi:hypothetical protein IAI10_04275 [Clostridium sp. 19966]|uniref:hypothetical protein n=1 Tax=Clostridium sp. 19966 TaxID=2768166 RepID=UPI0028DE006F|nr:hypothetical protein [Clostridium sp. 19966]MDT8715863.1 hypothetical protein [Clostridium sp. 19966]